MHLTEQWIAAAIRIQHLNMDRLPAAAAQGTAASIRSRYVSGSSQPWGSALSVDAAHLSSIGTPLSALFPSTLKVLFIPQTETGDPPVFVSSIGQIDRVLVSCPPFAYCVVALDQTWCLIESDRGEYLLCGSLPLDGVLTD